MTGRSARGVDAWWSIPVAASTAAAWWLAGTKGGVSRAPADGDVGPAGDDDPGALTSYVGGMVGVKTFTFATSRTFCVLDKVLVALGRTKVVYSLYILAHPRATGYYHDWNDLYIRPHFYPTSPLTLSHHEHFPAPAISSFARNGRKPFETSFIYICVCIYCKYAQGTLYIKMDISCGPRLLIYSLRKNLNLMHFTSRSTTFSISEVYHYNNLLYIDQYL